MKRLLHLLMLLLFVGSGLFFGTLNQEPTRVDFLFFVVEWPLALALASFFFAGALFGGLLTWLGSLLALRKRVRSLRAERAAGRTPGRAMVTVGGAPGAARGPAERP